MSTQFSPAPWRYEAPDEVFIRDAEGGRVAILTNLRGALGMGGRRDPNEVIANARLIAEAPALLALLQEVQDDKPIITEYTDWWLRVSAAIAKATADEAPSSPKPVADGALTDEQIAEKLRSVLPHFTTWSNVTLEQMLCFARTIEAASVATTLPVPLTDEQIARGWDSEDVAPTDAPESLFEAGVRWAEKNYLAAAATREAPPLELTQDDIRAIRNSVTGPTGYTEGIIRKAFEWGVETARSQPPVAVDRSDSSSDICQRIMSYRGLAAAPVAADRPARERADRFKFNSWEESFWRRTGRYPVRHEVWSAAIAAAAPAVAADRSDVLLRVIQRLNANPYSLTKGECIAEVQAMRAAMGTDADPQQLKKDE